MSYVLGHSEAEIRRLTTQAAILRPITERLLRSAGIGPGMRVLDVGCGAGDVALLAAELVGPTGVVVGIDRNREAVAVAAERARAANLWHVAFEETSVEELIDDERFDLAIGRYVLIHQSDPVTFIRAAASGQTRRHAGLPRVAVARRVPFSSQRSAAGDDRQTHSDGVC